VIFRLVFTSRYLKTNEISLNMLRPLLLRCCFIVVYYYSRAPPADQRGARAGHGGPGGRPRLPGQVLDVSAAVLPHEHLFRHDQPPRAAGPGPTGPAGSGAAAAAAAGPAGCEEGLSDVVTIRANVHVAHSEHKHCFITDLRKGQIYVTLS